MNIFTPYQSPLKTAECLDIRRLNSQIRECKLIINSITGEGPGNGWNKHPVSKMYKDHLEWIKCYLKVLMYYRISLYDTPDRVVDYIRKNLYIICNLNNMAKARRIGMC